MFLIVILLLIGQSTSWSMPNTGAPGNKSYSGCRRTRSRAKPHLHPIEEIILRTQTPRERTLAGIRFSSSSFKAVDSIIPGLIHRVAHDKSPLSGQKIRRVRRSFFLAQIASTLVVVNAPKKANIMADSLGVPLFGKEKSAPVISDAHQQRLKKVMMETLDDPVIGVYAAMTLVFLHAGNKLPGFFREVSKSRINSILQQGCSLNENPWVSLYVVFTRLLYERDDKVLPKLVEQFLNNADEGLGFSFLVLTDRLYKGGAYDYIARLLSVVAELPLLPPDYLYPHSLFHENAPSSDRIPHSSIEVNALISSIQTKYERSMASIATRTVRQQSKTAYQESRGLDRSTNGINKRRQWGSASVETEDLAQTVRRSDPTTPTSPFRLYRRAYITDASQKELERKTTPQIRKRFFRALDKGLATKDRQGIAWLKHTDGNGGFTHELRIHSSPHRVYGRVDEHGDLVFSKFINGKSH